MQLECRAKSLGARPLWSQAMALIAQLTLEQNFPRQIIGSKNATELLNELLAALTRSMARWISFTQANVGSGCGIGFLISTRCASGAASSGRSSTTFCRGVTVEPS